MSDTFSLMGKQGPFAIAAHRQDFLGRRVHTLVSKGWDEASAVGFVAGVERIFAEDKPNG